MYVYCISACSNRESSVPLFKPQKKNPQQSRIFSLELFQTSEKGRRFAPVVTHTSRKIKIHHSPVNLIISCNRSSILSYVCVIQVEKCGLPNCTDKLFHAQSQVTPYRVCYWSLFAYNDFYYVSSWKMCTLFL